MKRTIAKIALVAFIFTCGMLAGSPLTDTLLTPAQQAFNRDRNAMVSANRNYIAACRQCLQDCWTPPATYTTPQYLDVVGTDAQTAMAVNAAFITFQGQLKSILGTRYDTLFGDIAITSADTAMVPAVGSASGQLTLHDDGSATLNP